MATAYELREERRTDQGPDGNKTHTRKFMVSMDSATQSGPDVLSVSGIPPRYSQHPQDAGALLIRRTATQHPDSGSVWTVLCEYSTDLSRAVGEIPGVGGGGGGGGGQAPEAHDDPLQEPPDITFSPVRYEWAIQVDLDGALIRNRADEFFDPPETMDYAYLALDVKRNLATFNPNMIASHIYCTNIDPYLGFGQDEVLLDDIRAKPRWAKGKFYWEVSARFVFNPIEYVTLNGVSTEVWGGWFAKKLNAGYMKKVAGEQVRVVMADGSFPSRPQLLSNTGTHPYTGAPIFIKFRKWRRKSLQALGII